MLETLQPSQIVFIVFAVIGGLVMLSLFYPRFGCLVAAGVIVIALLLLTDNGGLAIVGVVAVGIVFLFVKFRSGGGPTNINIECGDGNNITINR